jgi:hypothetical protein
MTDDEREDTIQDLLAENDRDDLQRMKREMQDQLENTSDGREEDLLRHRLTIVEDAIERAD